MRAYCFYVTLSCGGSSGACSDALRVSSAPPPTAITLPAWPTPVPAGLGAAGGRLEACLHPSGCHICGVRQEGTEGDRRSSAAEGGCGNLSHRHASVEDKDLPRWEASSIETLVHLLILSLNDVVYK